MAGTNTIELTEQNFDAEVLQASGPVLVDFWAPWCPPCRRLGPIIDEIADEVQGKAKVGKVNVDDPQAQALAATYNVRAVPTSLVFRDGDVVDRHVGFAEKAALVEKLGV